MNTSFCSLPLRAELLAALDQLGFTGMTPIQAAALPGLLTGVDLLGQAATGSGKTVAYGLALLQHLEPERRQVQALVVCPTRELAQQVTTAIRQLAACLPQTRVVTLCGGHPLYLQNQALGQGCQVVVGTPGRLGEHVRRGTLVLEGLRVLVLDEADRLLDLGFSEQVLELVGACPAERQTLLLSATFPKEIAALSAAVQREAARVAVEVEVDPEALRQAVVIVGPGQRAQVVAGLLASEGADSALVFCETREDCAALAAHLQGLGASAMALHGQLSQQEREQVLLQLLNGSVRVVVATDVAARGLDVPALPLVIVAELSPEPVQHVHRAGRTARAGAEGLVISLVSGAHEEARLAKLEAHLGRRLERRLVPPRVERLDGLAPKFRTLLILAGRADKLRKGDVLGALVKDGGLPMEAIGRIDVLERSCAVAIEAGSMARAVRFFREGRIKGRKVRVRGLT
jgi:ATP-independent RNA helicase DbpA